MYNPNWDNILVKSKSTSRGQPMQYVYNVLAAILIGLALGAALGQPTSSARITGVIAIVLAVLAFFFSPSWIPLAVGVAVFLVGQAMQGDRRVSRS